MNHQAFKKLLQKYLDGQCTAEEVHLLNHWYALLDKEPTEPLAEQDWNTLEQQLWHKIETETVSQPVAATAAKTIKLIPAKVMAWAVAASVTLLLGWFGLLAYQGRTALPEIIAFKSNKENLTQVANTTSEDLRFVLADGSIVTLKAQSQLSYAKAMDKAPLREVYLKGEAFFEVKRDPQHPFLVHTGQVVTRVLGTSFNVKMPANGAPIEVEVKTGKVAVAEKTGDQDKAEKPAKSVILTPNQKATYQVKEQEFKVSLVQAPAPAKTAATVQHYFVYQEKPLTEVAQSLEAAYGVKIILNPEMQSCPLTADLTKESFYEKLDLICEALQATYEVRGTEVRITGKGCQ